MDFGHSDCERCGHNYDAFKLLILGLFVFQGLAVLLYLLIEACTGILLQTW